MNPDAERVKELTNIRLELEDKRHKFAVKHGFAWKRAQNFKNCIVIRWKTINNGKIDYQKIDEYVDLCHHLSDKYNLWIEKYPLLESQLRFINVGIYCFYEWSHQTWAIPNESKELQEYILSKLPKWARVSVKK